MDKTFGQPLGNKIFLRSFFVFMPQDLLSRAMTSFSESNFGSVISAALLAASAYTAPSLRASMTQISHTTTASSWMR